MKTHLLWKNRFHKNPLYFTLYADFEADNEIDISIIRNKTTNIFKKNPILSSYPILTEVEDVLKRTLRKMSL